VSDAKAVSQEQIVDALGSMSIMEVSDLVKLIKEKFDLPETSFAVGAAAPAAGAAEGAAAEEKTEFNVVLKGFGDKKIGVIKEVRAITQMALKEAKELVEGAPSVVKESVPKDEAAKLVEQLKAAGADAAME
jgi:large subunit ribosomal protein L7/L12